jgi:N-formylglutamate deformylase
MDDKLDHAGELEYNGGMANSLIKKSSRRADAQNVTESRLILHIPHASRIIPEELRDQIVLSDPELSAELTRMTDAFTDELFSFPRARIVRAPISRLLVDVERFVDDTQEPMSNVGMGVIYTHTADGRRLSRRLQSHERMHLVTQYYEAHHRKLLTETQNELDRHGRALIVDCHSFPSEPLPCDRDQTSPRPEFCIGTDPFHTPAALIESTARHIRERGYSVEIDRPYAGTMVPMAFYQKDRCVASIMIEVNRRLYMDELAGTKTGGFGVIREYVQILLSSIWEFQQQADPAVQSEPGGETGMLQSERIDRGKK